MPFSAFRNGSKATYAKFDLHGLCEGPPREETNDNQANPAKLAAIKLSRMLTMKLLIAAAVALAAPAAAQEPKSPTLAQRTAQAMTAGLPQQLNGGMVMVEAKAEGDLLLVFVEDPENAAAGMDPNDVAAELAGGMVIGFCKDRAVADKMFDSGFQLQAQILLASGQSVRSRVISSCAP